jgi:hypothetical protein
MATTAAVRRGAEHTAAADRAGGAPVRDVEPSGTKAVGGDMMAVAAAGSGLQGVWLGRVQSCGVWQGPCSLGARDGAVFAQKLILYRGPALRGSARLFISIRVTSWLGGLKIHKYDAGSRRVRGNSTQSRMFARVARI